MFDTSDFLQDKTKINRQYNPQQQMVLKSNGSFRNIKLKRITDLRNQYSFFMTMTNPLFATSNPIKELCFRNQFYLSESFALLLYYSVILLHCLSSLQMNHIETYNSSQSKRITQIRLKFLEVLNQISSETTCTYYDFLMVAKQLSFRFEEASHLMALKNFYGKSGNVLDKKKLADLLVLNVSAQSQASSDKTIIKFALNQHHSTFEPIIQMTNEDEENYESDRRVRPKIISEQTPNQKDVGQYYNSVDFKEKIDVIVSMKMHQMIKKVDIISKTLREANPFQTIKQVITYSVFKRVIMKIFNFNYQRIKISEDDIKTIFFLLDVSKRSQLSIDDLNTLKNPTQFFIDLKEFYKFRINPELIKNTQLKKGKFGNNTVQVFQLKNPSILELKQIESVLTQDTQVKRNVPIPNTKPRFGPLRHSYVRRKSSPLPQYRSLRRNPSTQIIEQKDKIQRILKASKQKKPQKSDSNETIASRLRRLFIHKVILPRQRMLDQQKQLDKKNLRTAYNLQVRSDRI